jgi:hypothetical protein
MRIASALRETALYHDGNSWIGSWFKTDNEAYFTALNFLYGSAEAFVRGIEIERRMFLLFCAEACNEF